MDVEDVVHAEFDGVDVGDDFLELVGRYSAFGEVVELFRGCRRRLSMVVVLAVVAPVTLTTFGGVGVDAIAPVVVVVVVPIVYYYRRFALIWLLLLLLIIL